MNFGAIFFAALAIMLFALSLGCTYEAYAVWTGKTATISRITAYQFVQHPATYMVGVFVFGVIFGALVTHFTNWRAVR